MNLPQTTTLSSVCEPEETRSWPTPCDQGYGGSEVAVLSRALVKTDHLICDFPNEPYVLLQPIRVSIEHATGEALARWEEANIAMTGERFSIALGSLAAEILDTYEDYLAEQGNLGPGPAQQLDVMSKYIAKRQPH